MPRTIISVNREEKAWLDEQAKREKVAMAEIVRRALRYYREQKEAEAKPDLKQLLEDTQGIWKSGDGLEYQNKLRGEWSRSE